VGVRRFRPRAGCRSVDRARRDRRRRDRAAPLRTCLGAAVIVVIFLRGVTTLGCAIAALFFARFWRTTTDRLFLWFAIAYSILAVDYVVLGLWPEANEWRM